MTSSTSELITELGRHIEVIYKSRSTTLHVKADADWAGGQFVGATWNVNK